MRTEGAVVTLLPAGRLDAVDADVPGDPSSAAFFVALAALAGGGTLAIEHVCVNPSRTGAFKVLAEMGALIEYEDAARPVASR